MANADWFGNIIGSGSAAMKMLDRIIILAIIVLLPNSIKLCRLAAVFTFFSDANNRDDIILRKGYRELDKGMD
ncbi:MAG: hypothetical protein M3218_02165 [Thermoproteota archaeon]|nr:hypothetical protein [Thermoproteota archaeon]